MPRGADVIRLGHALDRSHTPRGSDEAQYLVDLTVGGARLAARLPSDPTAVLEAEKVLDARPRPVYAFAGDLHPALGTIGLIFERHWARRCLQGVTRCDSGGLFGRKGAFAALGKDEAVEALRQLSTPVGLALSAWATAFASEIAESYTRGSAGYVEEEVPAYGGWRDARSRCIGAAVGRGETPDRRLWTWELRMEDSPEPGDLAAIVVSPEVFKRISQLRRRGRELPPGVKLISGAVSAKGVQHWFSTREAREALLGVP